MGNGRTQREVVCSYYEYIDGESEVATRGRVSGEQQGTTVSIGFADFFQFDDETRVRYRYTYTDRDTV